MSHVPNELDIKTDLRRCVMASLGPQAFEDQNCKTFLGRALKNLDMLKNKFSEDKFTRVRLRVEKAGDAQNPLNKRREDLLTAAVLI